MDSIKNSANFELSFIYFCEQYAWFTASSVLVARFLAGSAGEKPTLECNFSHGKWILSMAVPKQL